MDRLAELTRRNWHKCHSCQEQSSDVHAVLSETMAGAIGVPVGAFLCDRCLREHLRMVDEPD